MRIDKFIWAVRIYKTRTIATKSCNDGKVLLNNENAKASKNIKENDLLSIKSIPIWRVFKIIDLPKSRVGNKLVSDYVIEITPEEDLLKMNEYQLNNKQNKNSGINEVNSSPALSPHCNGNGLKYSLQVPLTFLKLYFQII